MGPWAVGRATTPPELRERAARMGAGVRPDYPSGWPAIVAVASRLGIGSAETRRKRVRQDPAGDQRRGGAAGCSGRFPVRIFGVLYQRRESLLRTGAGICPGSGLGVPPEVNEAGE
jgi:transposase-like protein